MKSKLFEEAILDARATQAAAIANAKFMMEEAFTPRLQSMLSAKLKEELGAEGEEVVPGAPAGEDDVVTSEEIEKILAELDGELKEVDGEGDDDEIAPPVDAGAAPVAPVDAAPADPAVTPVEGLGDVKTVEAPALVVAPGQLPAAGVPADGVPVDQAPADAAPADPAADAGAPVPPVDGAEGESEEDDEEINLEELLSELSKDDSGKEEVVEESKEVKEEGKKDDDKKDSDKKDDWKEKFNEACETVKFLQGQLNEVNLLNAKLLYANRLFKAHALNSDQKMKIIESFDLAKSIREVKLTFNNLSEAINFGKDKAPAKKSITGGFASQTTGTTKPTITESVIVAPANVMASRFQKLAGIKKK